MTKLLRPGWWFCFFSVAAKAAIVFQIGAADGDYHEFAIAGDHAAYSRQFSNDVSFVVGQSEPKEAWPYIIPGPGDAWAGNKEHPFRITFQAPTNISGYYRLVIDFVSTHPSNPPLLAIDINGEKVEHKLPNGSSDDALGNPKAGKHYTLRQLIPAGLLRMGENTIALRVERGSWALFDDVRLESDAPAPTEMLSLKTRAVPLFRRTPKGIERVVEVSVDNLQGGTVPAELAWSSKELSGSQKFDLHFGQSELQLNVPDTQGIELTLRAGGHKTKASVTLPQTRKWKVYIVPTTHTDVGYTDLQERVRQRHADNGVRMLEWLEQYPWLKWYSETFWQLNALLELHPEKTPEVFERLRQKRMGLSGDYANMLTGLCSAEALNRVTLDSRNLANRGGFELNSVVLDDVPSAIGTLPMVLANSGIKYFIEGANNDRAPYAGKVANPFYWEGPDGSRVLANISTRPGYGGAGQLLPNMKQAMEKLPPFLTRFETAEYPYDAVLVNGAFGDNQQVGEWLPKVVQEWNAQWEYPKLILALPEDFYGYIEKNFSNDIPVLKTDFGGWWEDGAGSSALETMLSRRAEERVVTAEMVHSLASMVGGAAYPKADFDKVWDNVLLYNEHTWGAAGSINTPTAEQTVKQWEVKGSFARDADAESRRLLDSGMANLAAMVPPADLVVFNSLAWARKAVVQTEASGALQDLKTKAVLPCQALPEGGNCFVAEDLPAIGYRLYRNQIAPTDNAPEAARISGNQIENEFYRVTLNPKTGGISSIYDRQIGCELVDTNSDFDLGELIYVTGGEGTYAIHSDLNRLPPPKFEYHRQNGTAIKSIVGPVFGELDSQSTAADFPGITMRVRLYRGLKQLDLSFELDKTETLQKEAVYLAFPFAFDAREGGLWLEYPDAITEPRKDQHASACRDWYSVQRWLAVSDGKETVELSPLDAPLVTLGGMSASTWPRELSQKRGHVFGYIMNNYWHTNYKASQGGRIVFRYSLTSSRGGFSKRDAVVAGWNMFCPPAARSGQGSHKSSVSAMAESLVGVEPAGLPLTTIKRAEDGQGFVFRCCDYAGVGGTAKLKLPQPARAVFDCNLVETEARELKEHGKTIRAEVRRFGPLTLKAVFDTR